MLSLRAGEGREVMQDFRMSDFRNKAILAAVEAEVGPLRTQLEEAQAARDAAIERGVEAYEWGEIGWEYRCLVEILAADTRQAQAENERQREPCGKCRVQGLVLGEAKRLLQNLLAWVPDNDVRREAARFLRMSERRVRAALRGEPSHHGG